MSRFAELQAKLEKQGNSPGKAAAIAASVGRRKYGAKKFAAMGAAGRKKASKKGK